jgi:PAS domain-containing protein
LLQTISMEVAAASDLASALEVVLREVCEKTGWVIGHAWVPNSDATALDLVVGWYCGDGELKPFKAASEASHFKPGVGLPGRVWESKQPAWIEDVINDPNFPRSAAARSAGLKTGVAIPILSRRKVIAVLEFFMRESRSQNEQLVNVIVAVAAQLGLMMERKRAAEQLSDTNEILQSILSNMGDAVIVADKGGHFLVFNPAAERMFGKGAMQMPFAEWSQRYGLYLADKITSFPHDQLPLARSIRGEEVDNVEMFVRHERAPHGLWTEITGRPLRGAMC